MSTALVLGLGRFGGAVAASRFLHRRGFRLRIADRCTTEQLAESRAALDDLEVDWCLGRQDEGLLSGIDMVVVNPAVPPDHPLLRLAERRGIQCTQEMNLFLEAYPGRVVAVTGTNGKSTTSTLLHAALRRGRVDALLGGNIGTSLLADSESWRASQVAVLEVSSYQLERLEPKRHHFHGVLLTRIGRDHLDRHGSVEAYRAAKARAAAAARQFLVHLAADPVAAGFPSPCRLRVACGRGRADPGSVGEAGGWLLDRLGPAAARIPEDGRLLHVRALRLLGDFHVENALLAAAGARLSGADPHAAALGIATCPPLPFRLQLHGILDGIRIYDNGVSTELESTRSALQTLTGPVHWVGGGKSKDGDLQRVADALAPHLSSAHVFGAVAGRLGRLLADRVPTTVHGSLRSALDASLAAASPGESVLFSPAFTSFDQYANFRSRAQDFHRWAENRVELEAGGPHHP